MNEILIQFHVGLQHLLGLIIAILVGIMVFTRNNAARKALGVLVLVWVAWLLCLQYLVADAAFPALRDHLFGGSKHPLSSLGEHLKQIRMQGLLGLWTLIGIVTGAIAGLCLQAIADWRKRRREE